MKFHLLHIFIFLSFFCFSQNLVKNPSFEQFQICPYPSWSFATYGVSDWWGFDFSDVFYGNSCANTTPSSPWNGMPRNVIGYQIARSGNAYTAIIVLPWPHSTPNVRQYLQGTFITPLEKDSLYCVSYWVSLSKYSYSAIQNVDAYINKSLLNWPYFSGSPYGVDTVLASINPQIKSDRMLKDTVNWMEVKGIYKASGGEEYITIGNFKNDDHTTLENYGPNNQGGLANYYLDDVSVLPFSLKSPELGNDTLLCEQLLPLTLSAPIGYDSLKWSTGETASVITATTGGKYWLRCTANGCGSITDTMVIRTYSVPNLKLRNDTLLCKGQSLILYGTPGFNSYQWNTGSIADEITVNKSGMYTLTAQYTCGQQSDSVRITYDSLPDYKITLGEDINICQGGLNEPFTLISNYNNLPDYNWNTGEKTSEITVKTEGNYFFKSKFFCGDLYSDTVFVQVCPADTDVTMYIPDAFTPNASGLNDTWQPVFLNQTIEELYVFDRWGRVIFTGTKKNNYSWDGTYKGQLCEQGVYAYTISYKSARTETSQTVYHKTGMICLVN